MTHQKFKPPVFTRRAGGKHTEHDAAWLGTVIANVKNGTDAAVKRAAPIAYHNIPPHDGEVPPGPRPSVAPTEPADVPGADDQTRPIDPTPYPTAGFGSMKRQQA
jgi:hypothetical protein